MGSLFISHSSRDRDKVAELCEWLTTQGFSSLFLDFDPESGIAAGAKWEEELYAQLRRADALLFVGSPASVSSQWCFAELAMARSLGKTIVPVAVSPEGSHPLLDDTQAIDLTGADEQALQRLRHWLTAAELDPERTFAWDPGRSPFPGLESFEERDAAVFFGRQAQIDGLLEQMRSSRRRYTGRLMAVVGPSGSGKSSLVRAGLLPRLRRTQPPWVVLVVARPADRPLRQLALALVDAFAVAGQPRSLHAVELALGKGAAGLVALAEELSHLHPGDAKPPVLVFVDQAEELVPPAGGREQAAVLAMLYAATRDAGPVWSVLTLRSEFLSGFLQAESGEFAFDDQLLVGPLEGARLAEIIERPADRAGLTLAPGLVGRMIADTGGGDALPLLAHTLAALHERARERKSSTITIGDYEDLGGVVGALRRSADEEHRRLAERGLGDAVIPALNRLVTVGPDGLPTRRRVARAEFEGAQEAVIAAFIDARLLTSTQLDGAAVVEVAHEALLRQWPPLADAIERHREELQLRSELEREAQDWERSGRGDDYLLPGTRLAVAARLSDAAHGTRDDLTEGERAFLAASRARQRAQDQAKRRRTQRAFGSLACALVVVGAFAILALVQGQKAGDQRDTAQATLLATNALSDVAADPGQSLALGLRAYATKRTPLTERALRTTASQATPQLVLRGHRGGVSSVAIAGDGRHLASAGADGTVRVWDWLAPHTPPVVLRGHKGAIHAVEFAGDGQHVASAGRDGTVRIWDWRAPRSAPVVLRDVGASSKKDVDDGAFTIEPGISDVAFANDGRHLATASALRGVELWDWRAPRTPPTALRQGGGAAATVTFAADGLHLASGGEEDVVRVWNWRDPRRRPTVLDRKQAPQFDMTINAVAFSPDGRHLASARSAGTTEVWDWRAPRRRPRVVAGRQVSVEGVAFSPDGRQLASAGTDGTVRVSRQDARRVPPVILRGHDGPVNDVAFAGDGQHLASAGADGTVRVWECCAARMPPTVLRTKQNTYDVAFAGDGRHVATGGRDTIVRVWDWRAPRVAPTELRGHAREIAQVTFAADGRHLASAGQEGTVRVWDWRAPHRPPVLLRAPRGLEGATSSLAFAGDGSHLAGGGEDGRIRIWDRRAPRAAPVVLPGPQYSAQTIAFSPDGRHLASAGFDGTVRVRDWRAPRARPTVLRIGETAIRSIAFAPDGSHIGIGSDDGILRIWNWRAPRGAPVLLRPRRGYAPDSPVNAVAFSSDGRHLASGGNDGLVRVWEWVSPHIPPIVVFRGHRDLIFALEFSGDGHHIVSAAADKSVRVWDCGQCGDVADVLKRARARAPRVVGPG